MNTAIAPSRGMTRGQASLALFAVLLVGAAFKPFFWRIELLGNFSSYQTVFGMITERYLGNGFSNIMRPEIFVLENGKPSLELIFFPLVSLLAGFGKLLFGCGADFWGRFVSVAAATLNGLVLYRIVRLYASRLAAVASVFVFSFSPYVLVYGRNFQNEALAMLFLSLAFLGAAHARKTAALADIVCSALALGFAALLRLHFILLAPALLLFFLDCPGRRFGRICLWVITASLLPLAWHLYAYVLQQRLDYVHTTLFMQAHVGKTFPHPLLLDPQFYKRFLWDVVFWGANPLGLLCGVLGLVCARSHVRFRWGMVAIMALSIPLLIPKKFVDEHFYLYPLVLPLSVLAGMGVQKALARVSSIVGPMLIVLSMILSVRIAWNPAFKVPGEDACVVPAAEYIQRMTLPTDWVIACHGSSGDLLYYARRLGWDYAVNPNSKETLSVYMQIKGLNKITEVEWARRNRCALNSVDWLEYLRGQGAKYFFVAARAELEKNPVLLRHLKDHYTMISSPNDPFYGFKL